MEIYSKLKNEKLLTLSDHTKMVINFSVNLAKEFDITNNELLSKIVIASLLHDIGKANAEFQKHIKSKLDNKTNKTKEKNFIPHELISWSFAKSFIGNLATDKYKSVCSAILYHHANEYDTSLKSSDIISKLIEEDFDGIEEMKKHYKDGLCYIDKQFNLGVTKKPDYVLKNIEPDYLTSFNVEDDSLFPFFDKNKAEKNVSLETKKYNEKFVEFSIVRAILVNADRIVSSENFDNDKILNNDTEYIKQICINYNKCSFTKNPDLSEYDEKRLLEQKNIVKEVEKNQNNICTISASAGFGKTLIGILHVIETRKKTVWVVPRITIADSTYNSIINELIKMKMNNEIKVGLMYGGELKKSNFTDIDNNLDKFDIIVTVIDTYLNRYTRNDLATILINGFCGNAIFDEYHEFISSEPLFAAFIGTLYTRNKFENGKTLLLSATGYNKLLNCFVGNSFNINSEIYGGDTKVNLNIQKVNTINEISVTEDENSFTIIPTVDSAINLYRRTNIENKLLLHSRFIENDKEKKVNVLYDTYGKNSQANIKMPVIGTNIISTGLDISAKSIKNFLPSPDETIQLSGRAGRFKEFDTINYTIVRPLNQKKFDHSRHLNELYYNEIRNKWVDMLEPYNGKTMTKKELYELRDIFFKKYEKLIYNFIMDKYLESVSSLSDIKYRSGHKKTNLKYNVVNKNLTYRGISNNIYCTVEKDNDYIDPILCDEYLLDNETNADSKKRYNFMIENKKFEFPDKKQLKYRYKIKDNTDATIENCKKLALKSNMPFLLLNYGYNNELGLYPL